MKNQKSILLITNLTSQMSRGVAVSETLNDLLSKKGWKIYTASGKLNKILRFFDMLVTTWKYKDDYKCAFVEVYSGNAFIWAELVCLLLHSLKKPFILGLFGGNLPSFAKKNPRRVDTLLRNARMVLAPSRYLLDQIKPFTSANIKIFPYGVDLSQFPYHLRAKPMPKLITMRGFHSIYCPWVAVEAIVHLRNEFANLNLVMSGGNKHDGSQEKAEQIIKNNAIEKYVKITGFIVKSKLEDHLVHSDILLNMSIIDNTPVSVIQAMACGLCIVSTNVGGLPYLIEDEKDGLLIPPNDPEAMAFAVRRILTEPGLAARLSANAHSKGLQYDWSVILPKWGKLFEEVIAHG